MNATFLYTVWYFDTVWCKSKESGTTKTEKVSLLKKNDLVSSQKFLQGHSWCTW